MGWVGSKMYDELVKRGHEVIPASHTIAENVLRTEHVDWVVNAAAVTGTPNVDACEYNKLNTFWGNTIYPIELYDMCNQKGVGFSHFSSGCIYEGTIDSVDADPNFFGSTYVVSKGLSDMYLKTKAQVFRIRMPFTDIDEPKNILSKIIKYAKTAKLYEGGLNSFTYLDEAIQVACDLVETRAPNGPYNLVNSGAVTLGDIVDLLNIKTEWYTTEEFHNATLVKRSNCVIPSHPSMSNIWDVLPIAIERMRNLDKSKD